MLCESIQNAKTNWNFKLHAFVIMPEHVHLLVYPIESDPKIDNFLKAIKRPFSYRIKKILEASNSELLQRLTVQERPGIATFRFWQEGPGYDRNLNNPKTVLASI